MAGSPSSAIRGLLTMWNVVPTLSASCADHQLLDRRATLGPPHRAEQHLAVLGEQLRVGVEVAGVEVLAVVDEQLVDRQQVLQPPDRACSRCNDALIAGSSS